MLPGAPRCAPWRAPHAPRDWMARRQQPEMHTSPTRPPREDRARYLVTLSPTRAARRATAHLLRDMRRPRLMPIVRRRAPTKHEAVRPRRAVAAAVTPKATHPRFPLSLTSLTLRSPSQSVRRQSRVARRHRRRTPTRHQPAPRRYPLAPYVAFRRRDHQQSPPHRARSRPHVARDRAHRHSTAR